MAWQNLPKRMLQRGVEHWHGGNAGLLRGSKATTYEGGFRVPAIVCWPGEIPAKQVSNEMATSMDLFATIANIAGGKVPNDREIDGHDILSFLKGEEPSPTNTHFYLTGEKVEAVRIDNWKLRVSKADGVQLFNLAVDPSEKYNCAEEKPEMVKKMYQQMQEFAQSTNAKIDDLK